MPRITTTLGQGLQAPDVSITPRVATVSPVTTFAKTVLSAVGTNVAEANKQRLAEEQAAEHQRILSEMNSEIDTKIGAIGPDKTPTQAISELQGSLFDRLSNSKIPPEKWGALNSLVSSRINTLGKQHFFSEDDQHFVLNNATGEVLEINPPGVDKGQETFLNAAARIDKGLGEYLKIVARDEGIPVAQKQWEDWLKLDNKADLAAMQSKITAMRAKNLQLSEEQKKAAYGQNKQTLFGNFEKDLLGPSLSIKLDLLRTTTQDPATAFQAWESQVHAWSTDPNRFDEITAAGYKDQEDFWNSTKGYRDAVKNQMNVVSKFKDDAHKIKVAELEVDTAVAEFMQQIGAEEAAKMKLSGQINNLANIAITFENMISTEKFKEQFPNVISQLKTNDTLAQERKKALKQNLTATISFDDYVGFINLLNQQLTIMHDPSLDSTGTGLFNASFVDDLASAVTKHPLWNELKKDRPEVAEEIERSLIEFNKLK